jgi:two-component system response regulator
MRPATHVLIAEDDENDRYLISRTFTKNPTPLSIAFARDGQEAIEYLGALLPGSAPKLLLLDLKMPRMDGFRVLEWLQTHPGARPERIVVLTSSVDPRDAQRTRELGADLYVVKPHDAREYIRMTRGIVDEVRSDDFRSAPGFPQQSPPLPAAAPK